MYKLAKDLGLRVADVMKMTVAEFTGWVAFYKIEQEETKKAMDKMRARR